MTSVGFEPTQLALVELESAPLDHSGKVSCPCTAAPALRPAEMPQRAARAARSVSPTHGRRRRKLLAALSPVWRRACTAQLQRNDTVPERFRRWTRNPLGSARRGSNPLGVVLRFEVAGLLARAFFAKALAPAGGCCT